jgi:hypothetical protein
VPLTLSVSFYMNNEWDKLDKFLGGVAAARELFQRAGEHGFFIEGVCLASNLIDAQLRIGIILKHQIETKSKEILVNFLQQSGKTYTERAIYDIAKEKNVIDQLFFEKLNTLYEDRNRVIHRYIITDITTDQVLKIAIRYEELFKRVRERIFEIEEEQINLGVGMTVKGPAFKGPDAKEWLNEMTTKKHGTDFISNTIKRKS